MCVEPLGELIGSLREISLSVSILYHILSPNEVRVEEDIKDQRFIHLIRKGLQGKVILPGGEVVD